MNDTQSINDRVGDAPNDDGRQTIAVDLACPCGYNLRGLHISVRCPECGREVADVLDDYEQATLDGRARRRLGASLLIANHLVWLCMLTPWLVGVRGVPRSVIVLLAAAGPRSMSSIEAINPGTFREFATSMGLLLLLQVAGLWMLATVRRQEGLDDLRRSGRLLRYAQLAAVVLGTWAMIGMNSTDWRSATWLLLELPVAVLLGLYLAKLAAAEQSRMLRVGAQVASGFLAVASAVVAGAVVLRTGPGVPLEPWFQVGLSAGAAGGVLLLTVLVRVRILLGRDSSADSDGG